MVSEQELARRYTALREAMTGRGYKALVVAGETEKSKLGYIRYLSDWRLFGGTACIVLPLDRGPVFLMGPGAQAEWAQELCAIADTRAVGSEIGEAVSVLENMGLSSEAIGVVGMNEIMSHQDATTLSASLPQARLDDATGLMQDVMACMSDEEISQAEKTHSALVQVLGHLEAILAPGKTEREVMAGATRIAIELGCPDLMAHLTYGPGMGTRPATDRRFEKDDIIKVYLDSPGPGGYFAELGGVFSFREPPEDKRRRFLASVRAVKEAAALMRPGVECGEICHVIKETYQQDGWNITGRRLWDFHGQGLNAHMPPTGMPESREKLKESMMLNIHPSLLTDFGWEVTANSNYIVTPEGGYALGNHEYEWRVVAG